MKKIVRLFDGLMDRLNAHHDNQSRLNERLITRLEALMSNLENPAILAGVDVVPVYSPELGEKVPSRVHSVAGGKAAMFRGSKERLFRMYFDVPLNGFKLKAWGGCVMVDVKVGNMSQMCGPGEIAEAEFDIKVPIGSQIFVLAKIPIESEF